MSKLASMLLVQGIMLQEKFNKLMKDENGEANIIAIILVLAIVIALAIIFRTQLTALFNKIWASLFSNVDNVL